MKVIVTLEYRFKKTPDGAVWTEMSFQYPFWQRYLNVYSDVIVVARVDTVNEIDKEKHHRVDGENVKIEALPHYHGPLDFFKKKAKVKKSLLSILDKYPNDALILRVGSPLADLIQGHLKKIKRPYGLEVVGDPWDVFRPGTFNNPLRPLMRVYFAWKLKKQCAEASALSYVTNQALQKRYPGKPGCYSIGASSINLYSEHLVDKPKDFKGKKDFRFIYVGTLEQLQKAPDIIIKALAYLKKSHSNFEMHFIGEGKCRPQLETLAKDLKVSDKITFHGMVPAGDPIRELLDQSDIFLLPSRGEGLPRAMIEAMARALPCIGSSIGGIHELIADEDIVPVGDINKLAEKMKDFMNHPEKLNEKSQRNLDKAKDYHNDTLTLRRNKYYSHIKEITENESRR